MFGDCFTPEWPSSFIFLILNKTSDDDEMTPDISIVLYDYSHHRSSLLLLIAFLSSTHCEITLLFFFFFGLICFVLQLTITRSMWSSNSSSLRLFWSRSSSISIVLRINRLLWNRRNPRISRSLWMLKFPWIILGPRNIPKSTMAISPSPILTVK